MASDEARSSVAAASAEEAANACGASDAAAEKIRDEMSQVHHVQEWWGSGQGSAAAVRNPILASIDPALLVEVVAVGGAYHNILSADRVDAMHRQLGSGQEPALEPLRRALQSRGGYKSQARAIGTLLFREARALYEQASTSPCEAAASSEVAASATAAVELGSVATPARAHQAPPPGAGAVATTAATPSAATSVDLDEAWSSPRRFVNAATYPEGAAMAARTAPNAKSEQLATLPAGFEYLAHGRAGDYLAIHLDVNGIRREAFVLHRLGDMVLLEPGQQSVVASMTAAASAAAIATATPAAAPAAGAAVQLDETWSPARRYVCAESYPEGAQMAVRAGPSREHKQIASLPAGFEYVATGRIGDYLQVVLEIEGKATSAYVLHCLGTMTLLVPENNGVAAASEAAAAAACTAAEAATAAAAAARAASDGRVAALEGKVAQQEQQIKALQREVEQMRSLLSGVAGAFAPLASTSSQ